jgi:tetratricopeptide (TPR) repeat protein
LDAARTADNLENWTEALRCYAEAVDHGVTDAHALFRLGSLIRQSQGNLRTGLEHLRKATLAKPDNIVFRAELADTYEALGFPINARAQRERIRQLQQSEASGRVWRWW